MQAPGRIERGPANTLMFAVIFSPKALRLDVLIFSFLLFAGSGPAAVVLQVGRNFRAARYPADSTALPPDAALGVSTNHLVELVNGRYSVFNKAASPTLLQTETDLSFWANAGITIPSGSGVGDPRVFFDPASQRWFATMIDFSSSSVSNRFLVAVSATADPTGLWRGRAFVADPLNGYNADFPTFGIDATGVYLGGNLFDSSDNPKGTALVSIPKSDLLANPPSVAGRTSFGALSYASYGEILQPVVTLGAASSPEAVLAVGDLGYPPDPFSPPGPHSNLVAAFIQNANSPGGATLDSPTILSVPEYLIPIDPPQPGGSDYIADGDARISAIVYRVGDILYGTHSTEVSNRAAIQWFKIDATKLNVIDTGVIADPVLDLFFPSIAANGDGTVMLAFNGSSATNFVSSYAIVGEPINGTLSFGNLVLLKAGAASYRTNDTPETRWGDYSAVAVDLANPAHFWALTEYPSSSTT